MTRARPDLSVPAADLSHRQLKQPRPEELGLALPGIERSCTELYARVSAASAAAATTTTEDQPKQKEEDEEQVESQINILSPASDADSVKIIKAPVCPFFLKIYFSTFEIFKVAFGTVVFVPIRTLLMLTTISIGWCLAYIATIGKTRDELQNEPFSGWRRALRWFVARCIMRTFFFFGGFLWVPTRGRLAPPDEAPILVAVPHSSYFDSLPLILCGPPSAVARAETVKEAFSGKLVGLVQAVYVSRTSYESRVNTVKAIVDRAQMISVPSSGWPHLFIYPEGTCGNRSCIIQFKLGAFIPGVPIQPVVIRYPNRMDHITWTFDGPGILMTLWLTVSQFRNYCVLEYLPVYVPSEEEKRDPALFANNVRAVMARALGIPTSDYTYEDGLAIEGSDTERLSAKLTAVTSFRNALSVSPLLEISVMRAISIDTKADFMVSRQTLAHNLLISTTEAFQFDRMFEFLDEYLKLLALEAVGLLQEYPPREHELRNSESVNVFSGYKKRASD